MTPNVWIGDTMIQKGGKPYFIADIAANHDGDLNRAFRLIELAKEAGANAAKFQNFKACTIVSKHGFDSMPKQTHQAAWKKSVYEVYRDASLPDEWTRRLCEKCEEAGIEYMTSPYDFDAVDKALPYSHAIKIGSGDITWIEMEEYIAKKGKTVLLATGASSAADVERAVRAIERYNGSLVLMQCNTNYTANDENYKYVNLNVLKYYDKKYPECVLGLSDHTAGHTTVLGAIALGASVFEKHFTDDNRRLGPDHQFAMTPESFRDMVEAAEKLYSALGDGIKKIEENEKESVVVQQRAYYTRRRLAAGTQICEDDLIPLRPLKEGCVFPYEKERLVGRRLKKDIEGDTCILWEDMADDSGE